MKLLLRASFLSSSLAFTPLHLGRAIHRLSVAAEESVSSAAESDFQNVCRQLCLERNLPLERVKNSRDLASVHNSPIQPGRIFRMGRLSDASTADVEVLMNKLGLKTLVDLRSPTELKDDPTLTREEVFGEFTDIVWKEKARGKDGCIKVLEKGEPIVKKPFWTRSTNAYLEGDDDEEEEIPDCDFDCDDDEDTGVSLSEHLADNVDRKERHFVSLMNEFKYVKGMVSKVRKRDITKAILKSPGALVSKRVRSSVKKPFLDGINDGGLPMLNELLLRFGAPGIKYVLELVADKNRHPIAFHCTAGKDRTGILAAIILALCGARAEDIVEDYSLSANVYAEMNDHQAMVGALSQRSLDPKTFLGAPPQVMRDTLLAMEEEYGGVEGYCNWIGFGPEKQEQLRKACLE